ncbi:MAG: tyrosine--tRNA ligase, partial [Clostridia bacterium]|nr:tyrosine--tRNA ligase [Clostridia bacterium]
WSNMLAGVSLIRKIHKSGSFCLTCPLLLNSDGTKMGKTVKGALWLDPEKTTPYEFYQYWRNVGDKEVNQILRMLTYIPMEEVNRLSNLEGENINEAKKIAAYEITKLVHGEDAANEAKKTAEELFENKNSAENMPQVALDKNTFVDNTISLLDVMVTAGVAKSKGDAKTLISQGGISFDDEKVTDIFHRIHMDTFEKGYVVLKKGKKIFIKLIIE